MRGLLLPGRLSRSWELVPQHWANPLAIFSKLGSDGNLLGCVANAA
jgi:hypothetical protein